MHIFIFQYSSIYTYMHVSASTLCLKLSPFYRQKMKKAVELTFLKPKCTNPILTQPKFFNSLKLNLNTASKFVYNDNQCSKNEPPVLSL